MNKIKHSKYRNTGLIFNLLVKQLTSDILEGRNSASSTIIKKYFSNNSVLSKENKLYQVITENINVGTGKANAIISTVLELSRKFNKEKLTKAKYELIKEVKENYDLSEFFSIKIPEYKVLAATYTLIECHNTEDLIDPDIIVANRTTILEHMMQEKTSQENSRDSLIEEYSKYDHDLRLLTYRILLQKFNNKYSTLLPVQKEILKEFIVAVSSTKKLRTFANEHIVKIKTTLQDLNNKVGDEVLKIKINELVNNMFEIKVNEKLEDNHLIALMNYYELIEELKNTD
jgi:hypothetical protein